MLVTHMGQACIVQGYYCNGSGVGMGSPTWVWVRVARTTSPVSVGMPSPLVIVRIRFGLGTFFGPVSVHVQHVGTISGKAMDYDCTGTVDTNQFEIAARVLDRPGPISTSADLILNGCYSVVVLLGD